MKLVFGAQKRPGCWVVRQYNRGRWRSRMRSSGDMGRSSRAMGLRNVYKVGPAGGELDYGSGKDKKKTSYKPAMWLAPLEARP